MSSTKLTEIFRNRIAGWAEPQFTDETIQKYTTNPKIIQISPGTLAGVEFEIENCGYVEEESVNFQQIFNSLWTITTDGSLRNNGKEFISKPLSGPNLSLALNVLDQTLTNTNRHAEANSRCGIHVHINTFDTNTAQLLAWISLYQVFERQLYAVSGGRDKNLFCLPTWAWNGNLMSCIGRLAARQDDGGTDAIWVLNNQGLKYAGMNTRTLGEHGTLEFRQMQTTKEIPLVAQWVDTLIRIKLYAINSVKDLPDLLKFWEKLSELNTTSKYSVLLRDVLGERQEYLMLPDYAAMMAKGIIQVKESIAKYKYTIHKSKAKKPEPPVRDLQVILDEIAEAERQRQPANIMVMRDQLRQNAHRQAIEQEAERLRARERLIQPIAPPPPAAPRPHRNRPVGG